MSSPDSNTDAPGDYDSNIPGHGEDDPVYPIPAPPERTYPDKATLMSDVQEFGRAHGYNIVVKTSSIPTPQKPHRVAKVWLRCDKGGTYRPRNGLTEETRKRKRSSRLVNCPFSLQAVNENSVWSLHVLHPHHNHPPNDAPSNIQGNSHRPRKGTVAAQPYDWPATASLNPYSTALVIIDMQRDFCDHGGYLSAQGYSVEHLRTIVPDLINLLDAFRSAGFPVYHTREGHRPDLSTLSNRERVRSQNNSSGTGIGDHGPLGRMLIRGEPGHDTIPELYPIEGEPVIDKPGRGAFAHTDFELLLRIKGIKNLVLAGVTTDMCVSTTMREANDRGFDCLVLEDGTAAADYNLHINALETVKAEGGILGSVAKVADVLTALDQVKKSLRSSTGGRASSPTQPSSHQATHASATAAPGSSSAATPTATSSAPHTPAQILTTMNMAGMGSPLSDSIRSHMAAAAAAAAVNSTSITLPMDPQMNSPYIGLRQ